MNDYKKALTIIQDRINDRLTIGNKTIKSFCVSREKYLSIEYNDGSCVFIYDENGYDILGNNPYLSSIDIFKLLLKKAKKHDIFLGKYAKIKILSKGETLEELAIAYDTSLSCLEI